MQRRTRWAVAAIAATMVGPALASPAQASDATLRAGVVQVLETVQPLAVQFRDAAQAAEESGDLAPLANATANLRTGLRVYKWSVVNRKASTTEGLEAKKLLLDAVRQYDLGLIAFQKAFSQVSGSSTDGTSLRSKLRTATKRIDEAVEDEAAALEALGIEG